MSGTYAAPTHSPFGGTPRAGGTASSGGHVPPLPSYTGGSGGSGGGPSTTLWIVLAGIVAVVVVAAALIVSLGGADDEQGGGSSTTDTTTDTTTGTGGYTPQIESNFLSSCTEGGAVSQDVCQCAFDAIEADVPFDRFMEIDQELTDDPDAQPQELVDIMAACG